MLHMMRELDTVSPVVWPAWCYTGTVNINIRSFNTIMSAFFCICIFFPLRHCDFGRSNGKGHGLVDMGENGVIFSCTFHSVVDDTYPSHVYLI